MYKCERTSFILLRFKNPNLLSSPLSSILHALLPPYPPRVLLLHRLPVESALIAQTSIGSRFHWYVLVSKFGLLKSSESLDLCPFVVLSCCLLFVVSFRLILHWSPKPSIAVLAERNDKAGDNFPTKTTWGLRCLSGNSYSYFSKWKSRHRRRWEPSNVCFRKKPSYLPFFMINKTLSNSSSFGKDIRKFKDTG